MKLKKHQDLEHGYRRHSRRKFLARLGRTVSNLVFISLLVLVCFLLFSLVQGRLRGGPPTVGGYRLFAVLSGSMSPSFETGSLVAVKPVDPAQLKTGDVITFSGPEGIVSHRIVGIETEGGLKFATKGDANNVADFDPVSPGQVIGTVALALPWLGRLLVFSQSRQGLLLLIVVPALVVLLVEGRSLWRYAVAEDKKRAAGQEQSPAETAL